MFKVCKRLPCVPRSFLPKAVLFKDTLTEVEVLLSCDLWIEVLNGMNIFSFHIFVGFYFRLNTLGAPDTLLEFSNLFFMAFALVN